MFLEKFKHPDPEFRGTDLWMLNGRLDPEELRRQIREMKQQGFHSFIARTYNGLLSDYPGPEFKRAIGVIIDEAAACGMEVFLQAGYMPASVPDLPERYCHSALHWEKPGEQGEGRLLAQGKSGLCRLRTRPHVLDILNPEAVSHYLDRAYDQMWQDFAGDFGTTVRSIWVDEPHFIPPDLPWTAELPRLFCEKWGYDLLPELPRLFEREGDYPSVRYHYWRLVLELLKQGYFQQVACWSKKRGLSFSGHLMGEDTLAAQIAYTASVMPLYQYFDMPGIDHLTGDLNWRHGQHRGHSEDYYRFLNTPLQCVGAAHQMGKTRVLCEMYGVSTQNLTFQKQRHIFDHFASLGINHKCIHALFYSLEGRRKRTYIPQFGSYQPYWGEYHRMTDYQARVSFFLSQGEPTADILCLHPVENAFMHYQSLLPDGSGMCHQYGQEDRRFNELLRTLVGVQACFELGDEDTLEQWGGITEDGRLQVGKMRYSTVIVPHLEVIRSHTARLLEQFSGAGGRVIFLGELPGRLDGRPEKELPRRMEALPGVRFAADLAQLRRLLEEECSWRYRFEGEGRSSLQLLYRTEARRAYMMLFNADEGRPLEGTLRLKGGCQVFRADGQDGCVHPLPAKVIGEETRIRLRLEKGGSLMIFTQTETAFQEAEPEEPSCRRLLALEGNWSVKAHDANVLPLEFCRWKKPGAEYAPPLPVLGLQQLLTDEGYRGPVTLAFDFESAVELPGAALAVENPSELTMLFNGLPIVKKIGRYLSRDFVLFALHGPIPAGSSRIEVSLDFAPLEKAKSSLAALYQSLKGVELEALYLVGSFGVFGPEEASDTRCLRYNKAMVLNVPRDGTAGELTRSGYPFYAGGISLSRQVTLRQVPSRGKAFLCLERMNACLADIRINGVEAGCMLWEPLKVEVTGLLHPGENTVEIRVVNTLRNLLGPCHRPVGEVDYGWSGYRSPDDPWLGEYSQETGRVFPDWQLHRDTDTDAWTDSYLQVPFGITGASLVFEESGEKPPAE